MAWVLLIVAGFFEVAWAYTMKLSNGFTDFKYSFLTVFIAMLGFMMLSVSMKTLPLGTAYTIWTGIGAVGAFVVGIVFLGEVASVQRITAAGLILTGLVMLKIST
ncbi:multidrug efflux SMR transporter [Aquitalea sp. LB_tupeE]|uniref:DMT family transporter n=1 Tax=Aquitalea sp. LB_tupeE TaxID=2748078 RepID=UPI0015C08AD5|nr:multidrug efflux SMR transporter [Aquitalea sp. LB_tupeE]NWK78804.1 multidrug efflux SMR transporter [Aquitalea sp. LB_tupeE]